MAPVQSPIEMSIIDRDCHGSGASPIRITSDSAAGYRELVLGVPDALLDLPAIDGRLAPFDRLKLGLRRFQLGPRPCVVDLGRLHRVVDQGDRAVLEHLEEPRPGRELAYDATPGWTRVEPAFKVAISGAWRASTPISPVAPGTTIISTSPSNAGPSGVTTETENVLRSGTNCCPSAWPFRPRPRSGRPCRRPARGARRAGPRESRRSRGSCPHA